jgi:hypothetical protein
MSNLALLKTPPGAGALSFLDEDIQERMYQTRKAIMAAAIMRRYG